jgi:DNA-nicking Smr family endonuclease
MKPKKQNSDMSDVILAHLERFGVEDKDNRPKNTQKSKKNIYRSDKNVFRYKLDLHGLTSEEARRSIHISLESCRQRGVKEILIIHGIGYHSDVNEGPVLKGIVRAMLENELHHVIRNFKPAPLKDGGDGATIVYLM